MFPYNILYTLQYSLGTFSPQSADLWHTVWASSLSLFSHKQKEKKRDKEEADRWVSSRLHCIWNTINRLYLAHIATTGKQLWYTVISLQIVFKKGSKCTPNKQEGKTTYWRRGLLILLIYISNRFTEKREKKLDILIITARPIIRSRCRWWQRKKHKWGKKTLESQIVPERHTKEKQAF